MKTSFWAKFIIYIPCLCLSASIAQAELYIHEVQSILDRGHGHTVVTVKFIRPADPLFHRPQSILLELPLCEQKSVYKLEQYCATEEGVVGQITALAGARIAYDLPDLSEDKIFAQFVNHQMPKRSIASAPLSASEVLCEASCFRASSQTCHAKGAGLQQAYEHLVQFFKAKTRDCDQCNLKNVVCDGKLLDDQTLQSLKKNCNPSS